MVPAITYHCNAVPVGQPFYRYSILVAFYDTNGNTKDKFSTKGIRCTNGQFFMPGKVLNTIYFLKGNNADNSN